MPIIYPAKNPDTYQPGSNWSLVWSDEFQGQTLNPDNWTRQILPKPYNDEWQQYFDHEENAYLEDGYLVLKAIHHSNTHSPQQYTSARLHTGGKQSWQYGKIAARIQLPHGQGIWPAFWMLGANCDEIGGSTRWPECGEIDIFELYGSRDDGAIEVNFHYEDNGHQTMGAQNYKLPRGMFAEHFHIFELEWNHQHLIWRLDGKTIHTANITADTMQELHQPYYLLLNIAVGGEWAGRPDNTTSFPALMYVDWVRVYQQEQQDTTPPSNSPNNPSTP
ncbi:MAG: glycoside hydrolase family 16 protein [Verrucomicrobiota bacterium]